MHKDTKTQRHKDTKTQRHKDRGWRNLIETLIDRVIPFLLALIIILVALKGDIIIAYTI